MPPVTGGTAIPKCGRMRLIDLLPPRLARGVLQAGYKAARCWWSIRRPVHFGALVGVHHAGRVLMLRQSYQPRWTFPGGGIEAGERAEDAAVRELREEIGLDVEVGELRASIAPSYVFSGRRDTVQFFRLDCDREPTLVLDQREIVEARWFTLTDARRLPIAPHLRDYLSGAFVP